MARAQADINSPYTFVKGLVTEANKLNEDLNLMTDGDNINVLRNGSCVRRKGVDTEPLGEPVSSSTTHLIDANAIKVVPWKNVNGDPSKNICLVQTGLVVHFFDMSKTPLSSGWIAKIDLASYATDSAKMANEPIAATSTSLALIIVNRYCEPIWVMYDSETNELEVSNLVLKIRDFSGIPDGLRLAERPTTLSVAHQYNLLNQGWADEATSTQVDLTGEGTEAGGSGTTGGGTTSGSGDRTDRILTELP